MASGRKLACAFTQRHLHTPSIFQTFLPLSFITFPHHFCFSCFQISHSFLAIHPFSFLFSITSYVSVILFISPCLPLSSSLLMSRGCGRLITGVQLWESKRLTPGRMKEGWEDDTGRELLQERAKKRERWRPRDEAPDIWRWFPTASFPPSSEEKQITGSSKLKCTHMNLMKPVHDMPRSCFTRDESRNPVLNG